MTLLVPRRITASKALLVHSVRLSGRMSSKLVGGRDLGSGVTYSSLNDEQKIPVLMEELKMSTIGLTRKIRNSVIILG